MTARFVVSLPEHLHERLRMVAEDRGLTMAELVRQAIEDSVYRQRPRPQLGVFTASGYPSAKEATEQDLITPRRTFEEIMGRDVPERPRARRPKAKLRRD